MTITAEDIKQLWKDPELGDGITTGAFHKIPIGKPKNFFRVHPDAAYRRRTKAYLHKVDGSLDETLYLVMPDMEDHIEEARPYTLVTVVYRDGSPRIWPIRLPDDSGKDMDAWSSARSIARVAMDQWSRLLWAGRAYKSRQAPEGYAPDPDWSKLPGFDELILLAFGEANIISDKSHSIYKDLMGLKLSQDADDSGL